MKLYGLIGRKVGMTRFFTDDGVSVPVSVIEVGANYVTQVKTDAVDGYSAIQVSFGQRRLSRLSKAITGHLAKAGVESALYFNEFRVASSDIANFNVGDALGVDLLSIGQKVDVSGVTLGKGYAGTIKRYNFGSGRASHGNSRSHNVPGSIGMAQDPGRVFPGKKMTGRLGGVSCTVQNLEVARVDLERGLVLIKGAIPGFDGARVIISPAIKAVTK